jgi:hypothetical protein
MQGGAEKKHGYQTGDVYKSIVRSERLYMHAYFSLIFIAML